MKLYEFVETLKKAKQSFTVVYSYKEKPKLHFKTIQDFKAMRYNSIFNKVLTSTIEEILVLENEILIAIK